MCLERPRKNTKLNRQSLCEDRNRRGQVITFGLGVACFKFCGLEWMVVMQFATQDGLSQSSF